MTASGIVRIEDERNGRYLPRWRYWLGYLSVALAWIAGSLTDGFDMPFWARVLVFMVPITIYSLTFRNIRRRTITE